MKNLDNPMEILQNLKSKESLLSSYQGNSLFSYQGVLREQLQQYNFKQPQTYIPAQRALSARFIRTDSSVRFMTQFIDYTLKKE